MPGHAALFALPFAAFLTVASPLTGRQLGLQCADFVHLFFRRFPPAPLQRSRDRMFFMFFRRFPRMHARCSTHVTTGL